MAAVVVEAAAAAARAGEAAAAVFAELDPTPGTPRGGSMSLIIPDFGNAFDGVTPPSESMEEFADDERV